MQVRYCPVMQPSGNTLSPAPRRLMTGAVLTVAALALSACGAEEPDAEQPAPSAEPTAESTLRVGVQLDSPGLAAGVDATSPSGLDVDLVTALTTELPGTAVEWVPITAEQAGPRLADDEIDLALVHGPVGNAGSRDGVTAVGPYLQTVPALLVPAEGADSLPGDGSWEPVAEMEDLEEAAVCVPDGADRALLELDEASEPGGLEQPSAAECALALTSGRVQAVLSDRVQLAGLAEDPRFSGQVEVLEWDDLDESAPPAVTYQVLAGGQETVCQAIFGILSDPDRMESLLSNAATAETSESAAAELAAVTSPC